MTTTARCFAGLGRLLWPAVCLVCREPAGRAPDKPGDRDLCPACADALPWNRSACGACALPLPVPAAACGACLRRPPPLTATRAVFRYAAPLDRLLPRLKFHGDLAAGRLCANLMADALAGSLADDARPQGLAPRVLIPLPLHRDRLRARGFDQALELARPLGRALALPVADDLLRRVRDTAPQSRLDAAARRRNLRGAFALAPGATPPAHAVLVDDVMTTGATLHAAADALLRAGAQRVDAWVCARVE
jgi:ComF family protein